MRVDLGISAIFATFFIATSLWSLLNIGIDPKRCDGNYLYTWYIPQQFKSKLGFLNQRYSLYLSRDKLSSRQVGGIPVLFIPGNAGNYKQVRAFASVAQRVSLWENEKELDIFAIETKDELSASDPKYLEYQAIYANEAISYIQSLYSVRPRSVVLIGHSMGGIVARRILQLPDYNNNVEMIFTLSSPHTEPPIQLKRSMFTFYRQLNKFYQTSTNLENVTIVSIAGGTRDLLVDSSMAHIGTIFKQSLSVYSTGVQGLWSSCDHEGTVWCEQLLTSILTCIYHLNHKNATERMDILQNEFLGHQKHVFPRNTYSITSEAIRVVIDGNDIQIPQISTGMDETRMHILHLVENDKEGVHFRLLTDIHKDKIKVHACFNKISAKELSCMSIDDYLKRMPKLANDWQINFRNFDSKKSDNRPEWLFLHFDCDPWGELKTFIVEVLPNANGFLYGEASKTARSIVTLQESNYSHVS